MGIAEYLRRVDDPKAVISYPMHVLYKSDTGHDVIGISPEATTAALNGRPLLPPLQVVRRPGLGDKVFAIAAIRALMEQQPDVDVTFSGLDTDTWMEPCLPWLKVGINHGANTVVNLDNTPCNGGDRAQLMGNLLGVSVTSIEFPIRTKRIKLGVKKPYYVFAPWAASRGPRSLPVSTILEVLKHSPIPLALTDVVAADYELGPNVQNCTGLGMLKLISLIAGSEGVVGVDSGIPWLASAMSSKPCLVYGSHVPAEDRVMTTHSMLWIRPVAACAPCQDHVGTTPQCRWKERVPACIAHLTPEFVRHTMREFERLRR